MRRENLYTGAVLHISPRPFTGSDQIDSLVSRFVGLFNASGAMPSVKMMLCAGHDPLRFKGVGALINAGHLAGAWIGCTGYRHRAKKE